MEKSGVRILYIEDDPGLARILQKSLRRGGYEVGLAEDGVVGLDKAVNGNWDLVISDYEMPEYSGLDVIRTLAEGDNSPPVIMLTGAGDEKLAVEAMKLGAVDYVVKDLDMNYLELLPIIISNALLRSNFLKEKEALTQKTLESEGRYRLLVDHSPNGIIVHMNGDIVFVNPAGIDLFGGSSASEIVDKPLSGLIHQDYLHVVLGRIENIVEDKGKMPWVELKIIRLDGKEVDVELSSVPFVYKEIPAILSIFTDITDRKAAQKRLEYMAHYDFLTDLPNRSLFFERMQYSLTQAKRYEHTMALLYLDLDRFKNVNDTLGHAAGDYVLKETGKRMQGCIRAADTVSRMGGDEFTVILSQVKVPEDAAIVAQKIIDAITLPFDVMGVSCEVGVSIGISCFPADGDNPEGMLKKADSAMYMAKKDQNSTYVVYEVDNSTS